jgi:Putative lumazine-binding
VSSMSKRPEWPADDEAAIRRAVHDYFEGWFEGDATRMERALHQGLAKRTLSREGDGIEALENLTAQDMIDATAHGAGTKYELERRGFEVDVTDVYETIANVVVYSGVYREYLDLVRTRDGWKIANALWQFVDDEVEQRGDRG